MKYIITRTSRETSKPCKEAYPHYADLVRYTRNPNDDWYASGENHTELDGLFTKTIKNKVFVIDFESLDQLMIWCSTINAPIIISSKDYLHKTYPSIEIYDDYRE